MRFCVYCGKQFAATDKFCPFCGKLSPQAASPIAQAWSDPVNRTQPTNLSQPKIQEKPASSVSKKPKTRSQKISGKAIALGLGSAVGLAALLGGGFLLVSTLNATPSELAAFNSGINSNCDRLGPDYVVEFATETDDSGRPLIILAVGSEEMFWTYEPVAGNVYLFQIDSIYSPSAVRAERLGCTLRFQAQP